MGDKIEHYCLLCMMLSTVLFIAIIIGVLGCASGFILSQWLGFNGLLMDFLVYVFGICGFLGTCYSALYVSS